MPDALLPLVPSPTFLRAGRRIDLSREPRSEPAEALTAAVVSIACTHSSNSRPVGRKGLATWRQHIGTMLGGLLREPVVSAQRNNSGAMWKDAPVGRDAFWAKAEAMERAGLLGIENGTRTTHAFVAGRFDGHPTKLYALQPLHDLAAAHGVTRATLGAQWGLSKAAQSLAPVVMSDLVVLRALKVQRGRFWEEDDDGAQLPIPAQWADEVARLKQGVERLNERVAAASVRGAIPPVFRRTFRHDLRLGGRFYTMLKADRAAMTIGGEPAVEVDISASQPTIFLARTDPMRLSDRPGLYDFEGFPSRACKEFIVQSFGAGRLIKGWSTRTPDDVRTTSVKALGGAVVDRFPSMEHITQILPDDLTAGLEGAQRDRAAGQHLVFLESQVVAEAMERLATVGVVALPLHDALVVPASGAEEAQRVLEEVFVEQFGVRPVVKVKVLASDAA